METKNEKQNSDNLCRCMGVQRKCCSHIHTSDRGEHTCISTELQSMAAPLYDRFDQLLDTAQRMLELLEERVDQSIDLHDQLIDALELKLMLKVGDTKFATMKKLFKTYEVDKKPYYLKQEILDVIRHYEVISNIDTKHKNL